MSSVDQYISIIICEFAKNHPIVIAIVANTVILFTVLYVINARIDDIANRLRHTAKECETIPEIYTYLKTAARKKRIDDIYLADLTAHVNWVSSETSKMATNTAVTTAGANLRSMMSSNYEDILTRISAYESRLAQLEQPIDIPLGKIRLEARLKDAVSDEVRFIPIYLPSNATSFNMTSILHQVTTFVATNPSHPTHGCFVHTATTVNLNALMRCRLTTFDIGELINPNLLIHVIFGFGNEQAEFSQNWLVAKLNDTNGVGKSFRKIAVYLRDKVGISNICLNGFPWDFDNVGENFENIRNSCK